MNTDILNIPDKLGCYRVGDFKVYSKLESIELHTKTGIHPEWDFNKAVFASYDWTVEPAESLPELYRQRAQQLRDRYDYIALWWSGGADSNTVLETFLTNDIKLDEIVTFSNHETTGEKDNNLTAEFFVNCVPKIEQLKTKYPWLKIRVLEVGKPACDLFTAKENKFDWIYQRGTFFTPNHFARTQAIQNIKDWNNLIVAGKKLCSVWGHEKPRIYHENGRFCFKFLDIINNGPDLDSISGNQPYTDELFYWTPDLPKIVIKQSHMIKNYLNANLFSSPYISQEPSGLAFKVHESKKMWLNKHGLHKIIYPNWNINTFQVVKSNPIISARDDWFFKLNEDDPAKKVWQMGVEKVFKDLVPEYWRNLEGNKITGIKACVNEYFLEK